MLVDSDLFLLVAIFVNIFLAMYFLFKEKVSSKYIRYTIIYSIHCAIGMWITIKFEYSLTATLQFIFVTTATLVYWVGMLYICKKLTGRKEFIDKWRNSWIFSANKHDSFKLFIYLAVIIILNVALYIFFARF